MSEITRRRSVFKVTSGGEERTVTTEAGIYIPSSDETSVTLTHTMGARPIQCVIVALDRTQCSDGDTSYVYSLSGSGALSNTKFPSAGWKATGASGNGSGTVYILEMEQNSVKFVANSTSPFRSGVEYAYEIMWVS